MYDISLCLIKYDKSTAHNYPNDTQRLTGYGYFASNWNSFLINNTFNRMVRGFNKESYVS